MPFTLSRDPVIFVEGTIPMGSAITNRHAKHFLWAIDNKITHTPTHIIQDERIIQTFHGTTTIDPDNHIRHHFNNNKTTNRHLKKHLLNLLQTLINLRQEHIPHSRIKLLPSGI